MTKEQYYFLDDLRGLDEIHLGMLFPSIRVRRHRAYHVATLCYRRGWIRVEEHTDGKPVFHLRTRGLRALQRYEERMWRKAWDGPSLASAA